MNNIGDDIAQAFNDGYEAGKSDSFAVIKELQAEIKTIQGRYDALKVFTDEAQRQIESFKPKRGEWISDRLITTNGGTYSVRRCSICEAYYQDVGYGWNYCPNCGAKMGETYEGA